MTMKKTFVAGAVALGLAATGAVAMAAREKGEEKETVYHSSLQVSPKLEDDMALAQHATVGLDDAVRTAQGAAAGKAVEASVENEEGNLVYVVEIRSGGEAREIIVDAGNGRVLANDVEHEDEDNDAKEGHEAK
jgi:uncharacterized membrane protein YkoI